MERRFAVKTGEFVTFEYELAGVGSRFIALAIDFVIQCAAMLLCLIIAVILAATSKTIVPAADHRISPWFWAFTSLVLFIIFFGYFMIFEIAWHGQTPGKRLLHLRVVRDGGQRSDPVTIIIRNVVRLIEAALACYFLSALVMLISPENKRLGDYAAGTIVIRT